MTEVSTTPTTTPTATTGKTFANFGLPPQLLQALERIQFTTPTPIQEQTLPLALAGRDILGSAQTGTGKTGAFGIPMLAGLMNNPDATALILTPTRELAVQVMATLQQMIAIPTIRTALLIGGEPMPKQFKQMNMNPRLVVGTPGRVIDHLSRGRWNLDNTKYLVLDETDRMLDMGFGIQLDKILEYVPQDRQTMMFSATIPSNIAKLSAKYLNNPERVSVGSTSTPAAKIKQETIRTTEDDKYNQLVAQLEQREGSVIIFVKTKYGAEKLATRLYRAEHKADAIHGDLKQNQRSRVIQAFREKKYRILVATDIAARGLDIPHIEHVVNYDLPQCPEDYIHRIGRTARAGAEGSAINLVAPADTAKWKAIQRLLNPNAPADEYRGGGNGGAPANRNRRFGGGNGGGNGRPSFGDRNQRSGGFSDRNDRGNFGDRNNDRNAGNGDQRSSGFGDRNANRGGYAGGNSGEQRNNYGDRNNTSERSGGYAGGNAGGEQRNNYGDRNNEQRSSYGERSSNNNGYTGGQRSSGGYNPAAAGFGEPRREGAPKKQFGGKPSPFTKDNGFNRKETGGFKKKFEGRSSRSAA